MVIVKQQNMLYFFNTRNQARLEDIMTQSDNICPAALKAARKQANRGRGLTQQGLADKIHCQKDTVSRWERGKSRRVRAHLREPLCRALGVEWDTLTRPPSEGTPWLLGLTRIQRYVSRHVEPALLLVARRYGITSTDVLDLAPLLFVIVAELSLLERQRRLDEIYALHEQIGDSVSENQGHLGRALRYTELFADETLESEKQSLQKRDIFGHLIEYDPWSLTPTDDDDGPFVHFVRGLAEGLPPDAVTEIQSYGGDMIRSYRVADDTLRELTGLAEDEEGHEILDHIREGKIKLNECLSRRRELDNAGYRQWLGDVLAQEKEADERELRAMFGGEQALAAFRESVGLSASQEREDR